MEGVDSGNIFLYKGNKLDISGSKINELSAKILGFVAE
jgi:hypothetical protein